MNINWFDTTYYSLLYKNRSESEAQLFIDNILNKINIKTKSKVLDLACGLGRHSKYLEKKGFNVVGIDNSKRNILIAKKNENKNLKFINQEMTKNINTKFDAVFNFFTSFGYLDHKYNYDTVENISKNLNSGGLFIIDFLNHKFIRDNIIHREEKMINNIKFNIHRYIKDDCIYKEISFFDNKNEYNFKEKVMLLDTRDFENYFLKNNLKTINIYGDYKLSDFDIDKSPRLIIISKKNPV
ncbi:MAG: SAM-dependent methyltransferase [Flavobacteriales bacterium]|nr:SAM-dependent methyltransferase [Flavobacteriales bacterium]